MTSPVEAMRLAGNDPVNRPDHYIKGREGYQPIDVLEAWFCQPDSDPTLAPLLWQVAKYISRAGRKGAALQDLRKAEYYLRRAIAREEKRG